MRLLRLAAAAAVLALLGLLVWDVAHSDRSGAAKQVDKGEIVRAPQGAAKRFVSKYGVAYRIVRDGQGSTLGHWGVSAFPETFLVDRRGRIVPPHFEGAVSRERLDEAIQRVLAS